MTKQVGQTPRRDKKQTNEQTKNLVENKQKNKTWWCHMCYGLLLIAVIVMACCNGLVILNISMTDVSLDILPSGRLGSKHQTNYLTNLAWWSSQHGSCQLKSNAAKLELWRRLKSFQQLQLVLRVIWQPLSSILHTALIEWPVSLWSTRQDSRCSSSGDGKQRSKQPHQQHFTKRNKKGQKPITTEPFSHKTEII